MAKHVGVNRNTVNACYNNVRKFIFAASLEEASPDGGEFEMDESYILDQNASRKRGRGAAWKTPVFGLLKRGGKVFVTIVKNCLKDELMPITQGNVLKNSTIHTEGWASYDGLILNGYEHYRVFHSKNEFAQKNFKNLY